MGDIALLRVLWGICGQIRCLLRYRWRSVSKRSVRALGQAAAR